MDQGNTEVIDLTLKPSTCGKVFHANPLSFDTAPRIFSPVFVIYLLAVHLRYLIDDYDEQNAEKCSHLQV
ncbi:hypothetical protein COOONC_17304 [Cooperia oncophora]